MYTITMSVCTTNKRKKIKADHTNRNNSSITTATKPTAIKIGGMHCAGCVNAIQGYVSDLSGVK